MDISVATFAFFVLTVKSLEQFPYTVSYGSRRYNRCIQCGKNSSGCFRGARKGAWEKRQEHHGLGKDFLPPRLTVGIAATPELD